MKKKKKMVKTKGYAEKEGKVLRKRLSGRSTMPTLEGKLKKGKGTIWVARTTPLGKNE